MQRVACVARGKLSVLPGEGAPNEKAEPRELESPYVEQMRRREAQQRRKNAWKSEGSGARFMAGGGRAALWGDNGESAYDLPPARFIGVARGRSADELFYAISTGVVSGVFGRSFGQSDDEHRIFHDADTKIEDLSFNPERETFAFTVQGKAGSTSLAILGDDGRGIRTVTEGDALDRAPRWVPGENRIVYSSAGIGRTESGHFSGLAPFAVQRLCLDSGTVDTLLADGQFDYLAPVAVSAEEVYAIRRPYRAPNASTPFYKVLLDLLLAPFRLIYAVFQYLNFFTARYTGKPLSTSGNARQKAADARQMMVWGNLVDVAQDADREASKETRGTVNSRYELVAITPKGVRSLAKSVLAFDVSPDGTVFYSTGSAIVRLANGKSRQLADLERVEHVCVCC